MTIHETDIAGLLIIEPRVFRDERGYFFESYNQQKFEQRQLNTIFVQDNQSKSVRGVVRGLHYQLNPFAQTKLVRVLQGVIYDVAVDIRKGSPTFGKWFGLELSDENMKQLLVPKGFAHGFSVLSQTAVVFYKCDYFYNPEHERGIRLDDPELEIDWKISQDEMIISSRDADLPPLSRAEMNFN
jgi:dTDP-4-dehydrorhamnose 3,5-epimerase